MLNYVTFAGIRSEEETWVEAASELFDFEGEWSM